MYNPNSILIAASADFVALCESQMVVLHQVLGANWSAIYLTSRLEEEKETKLIPLVIYPEPEELKLPNNALVAKSEFLPELKYPSALILAPSSETIEQLPKNILINNKKPKQKTEPKQIVLPLIYQELFMGLLVTKKQEECWSEQELKHIQKIADTLAIACFLDQRQQWYQKQLAAIKNLRTKEHDQIHDLLHQLRNPLTALRTFSKLLLKRILPEDKNKKFIESIWQESAHLQELLEQFEGGFSQDESLVLVNNIQRNKSNFLLPENNSTQENVVIKAVLEPLLASAEVMAQEKEIDFKVNISENLPTVKANFQALREVCSNLIDNAFKYTPMGGKIKIDFPQKSNYQGISISDSGYGIPKEEQRHIFTRYYRGRQAKSDIPGTGLGLAIAKELIETMEGKIELISPNDLGNHHLLGTTFIIWLRC